jgi:dTDP-4-amino-4,6-dideoxygalactose transaminase
MRYYSLLRQGAIKKFYQLPQEDSGNAHMFYMLCRNLAERSELIAYLKERGVTAVFHYLCLHESEFFSKNHDGRQLKNCKIYEDNIYVGRSADV